MNILLLHPGEIADDGSATLSGRRATHIRQVLHGAPGQSLRIGVIDGPKGAGLIQETDKDRIVIKCSLDGEPAAPPLTDLLLALPRPKVMKRLWSPLAALGVDNIFLTNAGKVERNYFDTHWLQPEHYEPLLLKGLEQAADTHLPKVRIINRLKPFIEDELDSLCPASKRLLAHPLGGMAIGQLGIKAAERVLLALGPEGGWNEFELNLLEQHGFSRITMGARTLQSDVACIALLGIVNAAR